TLGVDLKGDRSFGARRDLLVIIGRGAAAGRLDVRNFELAAAGVTDLEGVLDEISAKHRAPVEDGGVDRHRRGRKVRRRRLKLVLEGSCGGRRGLLRVEGLDDDPTEGQRGKSRPCGDPGTVSLAFSHGSLGPYVHPSIGNNRRRRRRLQQLTLHGRALLGGSDPPHHPVGCAGRCQFREVLSCETAKHRRSLAPLAGIPEVRALRAFRILGKQGAGWRSLRAPIVARPSSRDTPLQRAVRRRPRTSRRLGRDTICRVGATRPPKRGYPEASGIRKLSRAKEPPSRGEGFGDRSARAPAPGAHEPSAGRGPERGGAACREPQEFLRRRRGDRGDPGVAFQRFIEHGRHMASGIPSPYLTEAWPGVGGRIKDELADFIVEEVPLYPPSGEGEHVYFEIEKTDLSTLEALERIGRALRRP